ncbi:MAG: DNA polymerase III subunit delta [Candidatus Portnoybacteria bacterium]|nr:DNA polymerase III subunit delta [Candidatus Portnoybacteria bacterium]
MLIFLYGPDTYRSKRKLSEIIEEYKKVHCNGLSLVFFNGGDLKLASLKEAVRQTSIFDEKKLLVISNVFANQDFKEKFLKNSEFFESLKDTVLFYEEDEIPAKDKFFAFLKKKAKAQNFQLLQGENLKKWVKQELAGFKAEISPDALTKLVDSVGSDLWQLSNEINKLVSFKGKERKVNLEDVELLVKPKIETAIFKTIDAIAQKDKKQALLLIHRHLKKGDSPLYLLSMINFQFRNLLAVKDLMERRQPYGAILKAVKLHPFVVKKSYYQAQKFTLAELKKIYRKIFQADLDIKTGKVNPETALDLLIAET